MNRYYIYVHTNKINGKRYVGLTSAQNPNRRWNNGKGYGDKQPVFRNAIAKYGWENFTHEILLTGLTRKQACEWEQYYIEKLETFVGDHPDKGYNMTKGGEGSDKGKNCGSKEYTKAMNNKLRDYQKQWRQENKEHDDENHRKWRQEHPEQAREQRRKWRENNKEKTKQMHEKYKESHPLQYKNYREQHKEELKEYAKSYYLEHKEKFRESNRKRRERLKAIKNK